MDSLAGSRRREARRGAGSADKILDRNSNFRELWRPEGEEGEAVVGVVGYGSLLSERSALSTFDSVENFRLGIVRGYRRVFKHVAPIFLERGIAIRETMEMASLSVEEGCDEDAIVVSLFDMKASEVPAFISREEEYRFVAVTPEELDGSPSPSQHVMCLCSSDEDFIRNYGEPYYNERYGKYNIGRVWDLPGILPCPVYLRHCTIAAEAAGEKCHESFLDSTFIASGRSIRRYLKERQDILTTLPPEHLRERYGG
ncbi:hypothetical protein HKI87_03g24610 [Chloropicon roscoffensis]|uniref:Gamma-glutamylcyclotransferase family protein n=1 Tax=Chloropicon roscoffensis TaxID=1461544 RepID=A0AAX4P3L6_9CHLO